MKCPSCAVEMVKGKVRLHGSWVDSLFRNYSKQQLYFQEEGSKEEYLVLAAFKSAEAYCCPECHAVLVLTLNDLGILSKSESTGHES